MTNKDFVEYWRVQQGRHSGLQDDIVSDGSKNSMPLNTLKNARAAKEDLAAREGLFKRLCKPSQDTEIN